VSIIVERFLLFLALHELVHKFPLLSLPLKREITRTSNFAYLGSCAYGCIGDWQVSPKALLSERRRCSTSIVNPTRTVNSS
jgi:hypothetical protein